MAFTHKPEHLPTKIPTEIEVAWAAGVYEGEGCCPQRAAGSRKWNAAVATIVQKDPEILHKLRDLFGGKVRFAKGALTNPGSQVFVLEMSGDNARLFLARIYKYLSSRRKAQIERTRTFSFLDSRTPEAMTIEEIKTHLDGFNRTRYKYQRGTTPEAVSAYKNTQKRLRRAQRGESTQERVN